MFSSDSFRRRGYALIILGLFLIVFMGGLIIKEADRSARMGELGSVVRDAGGTMWPAFVFAFLGFFLSFGIVSVASGVWEIMYERPNPMLRAIALAMFVAFMALAVVVSYFR
jgi:hypothetical protein